MTIADELGISVGGASKSVDRLERQGWSRRLHNPGDRRSSVLELTAQRRQQLAAGNAILEGEMRRTRRRTVGVDLKHFADELARLRVSR